MATLQTTVKGIEIEIEATGDIISGGSNSYGSDEPAWDEVENVEVTHNGRDMPLKVLNLLDMDAICEAIIDQDGGW